MNDIEENDGVLGAFLKSESFYNTQTHEERKQEVSKCDKNRSINKETYKKISAWNKKERLLVGLETTELTIYEKMVWLVIHGAEYEGKSTISIKTIAKRSCCCERKTKDSIKTLMGLGYLEKVHQGNSYTGASTYVTKKPKG